MLLSPHANTCIGVYVDMKVQEPATLTKTESKQGTSQTVSKRSCFAAP